MFRNARLLLIPLLIGGLACTAASKEIIDPEEAKADPDFAIQGEYVGELTDADGQKHKVGCQVIARGGGQFEMLALPGGLPGDGWKRGDKSFRNQGKLENGSMTVTSDEGITYNLKFADGTMNVRTADGRMDVTLKRVERKSPTLGAKPPEGALVIFDGKKLDMLEGDVKSHLAKDGLVSGVTTKALPNDYTLHLEFRLSWMPEARGQGRSNSGVYLYDCYECQVLDSFGLEGYDNECGGFYQVRKPDVNMCLPPLVWQTYDVDFTAPKYEDGKKVANARVTVRHNGVVIHDDIEFKSGTPGRQGEGPGPRGIHLQGHGNMVLYRNIWVQAK
ncbi:MAG: DUF1080 domain-containing protein [Pirellulales bacterium]|nr:DUF1080 domain-containing protein [Pirellulales bacterium]